MARKTHNELTAGIFVLVALAVLLGVIVWLGGAGLFSPARQRAFFYAEEQDGSTNLQEGSFVLIGDDPVGKIARIRFDADAGRTFYTAEIERGDVTLHADGKVRVAAGLIGGSRLVIVDRGSEDAPLADAEHPVHLAGGMDQAMGNIEHATEQLAAITDVVARELNAGDSAAILAKIHDVIDSLTTAAGDVATIAASVKAETDTANDAALLAKLHSSMDDVNAITGDAKPKFADTLTAVRNTAQSVEGYAKDDLAAILVSVREASTEVLKISRNFADVSGEVRELVMLHRDNIDEMIDNMTQVSANLKATAKEVRRNPWRLLHSPDEKELDSQNIYDAAAAFSNGAEQLDQALAKLTGLAEASPEGLPADDPDLMKVRAQLDEAFSNFNKAEQALWKELAN